MTTTADRIESVLSSMYATDRHCAVPSTVIRGSVNLDGGSAVSLAEIKEVCRNDARFACAPNRKASFYLTLAAPSDDDITSDDTTPATLADPAPSIDLSDAFCDDAEHVVDADGFCVTCSRWHASALDPNAPDMTDAEREAHRRAAAERTRAHVLDALESLPNNRALAFVIADETDHTQDEINAALDALVADERINNLTTDESTPAHLHEYALPTESNVLDALAVYTVPQRVTAPATRPGFEPTDENHAPRLVLDSDAEHVEQAIVELLASVGGGMTADDARTALGYRLGTVDRDDFRATLSTLCARGTVHTIGDRYCVTTSNAKARRVAASAYFQCSTRSTRKTIRSTDMNTPAPFDAVLIDTVTARIAARRIGRMTPPVFLPRLPADERPRCDDVAASWKLAFGSRARCVAVPRGTRAPHAGVFMTARQARRVLDAVYGYAG